MSDDVTTESPEITDNFILTDELREKAGKKPVFNILYVSDQDSKVFPFRGEIMVKRFREVYEKQAEIAYTLTTSSRLAEMTLSDLSGYNILHIDNVSSYKAAKNVADIQQEILTQIDPDWKETVTELSKDELTGATEFIKELNAGETFILTWTERVEH